MRNSFYTTSRLAAALVLTGALIILAGCGLGAAAGPGAGLDPAPQAADVVGGTAHGGYAPIVGAYAQLFQSQNNGYGGAGQFLADNLFQSDGGTTSGGHNLTGLNGEWSFDSTSYTCTSGDLLYVVISGGNSGSAGNNNNILELAPIGICGVTSGISTSFTYVNELSTIATAYALGNFITVSGSTPPYTVNISTPANNNYYPVSGATVPTFGNCTASATYIATGSNDVSTGTTCTASGFQHAYNNYLNLVNMTQAGANAGTATPYSANTVTPGNSTSSVPAPEINSLANVLQSCVNTTGVTSPGSASTVNYTGNGTAALVLTVGSASDLVSGSQAFTVTTGSTTNSTVTAGSNTVAEMATAINANTTLTGVGVSAVAAGNVLTITETGGTISESGALTDVGSDGTSCGQLLALAMPYGSTTVPHNTLQAAMNIAKNPFANTNNVTKLFNLATAQPAFTPVLSSAPADWTIAVIYQSPLDGQATGFTYGAMVDADDNVYSVEDSVDPVGATPTTSCVNAYSANGNILSGSGWFCNHFTGLSNYLMAQPDALGNLWIPNGTGTATTNSSARFISRISASTGSLLGSYAPTTLGAATQTIFELILNKNNDLFFNIDSNNSGASQILKNTGNVWPANASMTSTTAGNAKFPASPRYMLVDTNSNIWGAESGANATSKGGAVGILPSAAATPPTYNSIAGQQQAGGIQDGAPVNGGTSGAGSSNNSQPFGIAMDASGNAWVNNIGAGTLTAVGISKAVPPVAYPVVAPATVSLVFSGTTNSGLTKNMQQMEVDGASQLWTPDSGGFHMFNLAAQAEVSESGGFKPCYIATPGATTCTNSYSITNNRGVGVDAAGDVWVVNSTWKNSSSIMQGLMIQIIGTGFPVWPLKAQQQPGIPAGCVTALSGGTCN